MQTASARRELAIVVALAATGLVLAFVVAFAPWYSPAGHRDAGATVVQTYHPETGAEAALGR